MRSVDGSRRTMRGVDGQRGGVPHREWDACGVSSACACSGSACSGWCCCSVSSRCICSTAAIFSLFFLLLAPAAVIAPALGDGGRAAFGNWVTRLLGAVCAKLIYSFLLGVVLLMQRTLAESSTAFGWARTMAARLGDVVVAVSSSVISWTASPEATIGGRTCTSTARCCGACGNGHRTHPSWCAPGNGSKTSCAPHRRALQRPAQARAGGARAGARDRRRAGQTLARA